MIFTLRNLRGHLALAVLAQMFFDRMLVRGDVLIA